MRKSSEASIWDSARSHLLSSRYPIWRLRSLGTYCRIRKYCLLPISYCTGSSQIRSWQSAAKTLRMEEPMSSIRLAIVALLVVGPLTGALAQGTRQSAKPSANNSQIRSPVATQPSNNPFSNPISQGVPPAVSANPNINSSRTNVPRWRNLAPIAIVRRDSFRSDVHLDQRGSAYMKRCSLDRDLEGVGASRVTVWLISKRWPLN